MTLHDLRRPLRYRIYQRHHHDAGNDESLRLGRRRRRPTCVMEICGRAAAIVLASDVGEGAGPYAKVLAEEIAKPDVEAVKVSDAAGTGSIAWHRRFHQGDGH